MPSETVSYLKNNHPNNFKLYNEYSDTNGFYKVVSVVKSICCEWPLTLDNREFFALSDGWRECLHEFGQMLETTKKITLLGKITNTIQRIAYPKTYYDLVKGFFAFVSDFTSMGILLHTVKFIDLDTSAKKTAGLISKEFFKKVFRFSKLMEDFTDLVQCVSKIHQHRKVQKREEEYEKKGNYDHCRRVYALESENLAWIYMAKNCASIAATVLGIFMCEPFSSILLLSLTTSSLILSMSGHFYSKNMTYIQKAKGEEKALGWLFKSPQKVKNATLGISF